MRTSGWLLCMVFLFASCGKDNDIGNLVLNPQAVALQFPENLTQCLEGTVISPTQSDVTFRWNPSENTVRYELHVTNLISGTTDIYNTENTEQPVRLIRGVPYSWFVISLGGDSSLTASSEIWSFYNAGVAEISFIPFPASPLSPPSGAVLNGVAVISLNWEATDLDNDISGYDIYFGTSSPPPLYQADLSSTLLEDIPVNGGMRYYWRIKTKDTQGNESLSEIFTFEVN